MSAWLVYKKPRGLNHSATMIRMIQQAAATPLPVRPGGQHRATDFAQILRTRLVKPGLLPSGLGIVKQLPAKGRPARWSGMAPDLPSLSFQWHRTVSPEAVDSHTPVNATGRSTYRNSLPESVGLTGRHDARTVCRNSGIPFDNPRRDGAR